MKLSFLPSRRVALSLSVALVISACASTDDDELVRCREHPEIYSECGEYNIKDEPEWKEATSDLPPLPEEQNLAPIDAFEAREDFDYFVDRASIALGSDEVMRYSVVLRSKTGKVNVFHEGIRCATSQARTYAYASSGGEFRRSANARWKLPLASGARGYQAYLANVIMCDRQGHAWQPSRAIAALDAQYTAGGVRIERHCLDLQDCAGYYQRHD